MEPGRRSEKTEAKKIPFSLCAHYYQQQHYPDAIWPSLGRYWAVIGPLFGRHLAVIVKFIFIQEKFFAPFYTQTLKDCQRRDRLPW
jgi:hypothetical protein